VPLGLVGPVGLVGPPGPVGLVAVFRVVRAAPKLAHATSITA